MWGVHETMVIPATWRRNVIYIIDERTWVWLPGAASTLNLTNTNENDLVGGLVKCS
jgi:hypothetical protein